MLNRLLVSFCAPLLIAGCATKPAIPPESAPPVYARGMVSAADPRAAEAGAQVLRAGGNAIDAAMATMLALTVVEPQSSGVGGGGFLVLDSGNGMPVTYDGRETAPAAATPDRFIGPDGAPMAFADAWPGGLSTGVPGNVALMAKAHGELGRLPWAELFAPAISLAREGFTVSPRLHDTLASARTTGALSKEAQALYYCADGEPVPVGTHVRNPALAAFFEQLATEGPDAFYAGQNAAEIAKSVASAPLNPAILSEADLAAYEARERDVVCGLYRSYRICGMGPPSSGATTVFAILKQLENFDLTAHGPNDSVSWHLIAESMRLAYADRGRYLADSDFVSVPVADLIDSDYLASRGASITEGGTLSVVEPGTPPGLHAVMRPAGHETPEHGTSHFVAIDTHGTVASYTSTIESAFGSGLMVNGYYLNNELTDFSFAPAKDGTPVANRVEAGKRPRSSMSPTIVYAPDGTFRLAIGAAGGATIIAQVAKAIIGVIDWNLSAQDAIALPLIYAPGDTVIVERDTALETMIPALAALGHKDVRPAALRLKANAVERVDGKLVGAADPRSEGSSRAQ